MAVMQWTSYVSPYANALPFPVSFPCFTSLPTLSSSHLPSLPQTQPQSASPSDSSSPSQPQLQQTSQCPSTSPSPKVHNTNTPSNAVPVVATLPASLPGSMTVEAWNNILSLSHYFLSNEDGQVEYDIMKAEVERIEGSLQKSSSASKTTVKPQVSAKIAPLSTADHAALAARLAVLPPSALDFHRMAKKYHSRTSGKRKSRISHSFLLSKSTYFSRIMGRSHPSVIPAVLIVLKYALWSEDVRDETLAKVSGQNQTPSHSDALLSTILATLTSPSSKSAQYECQTERNNLVRAIRGIQMLRRRAQFPEESLMVESECLSNQQTTIFSTHTREIYIPSIYAVIAAWKGQVMDGEKGRFKEFGGPEALLTMYLTCFPHTEANLTRFIRACGQPSALTERYSNGKLQDVPSRPPSSCGGSFCLLEQSWETIPSVPENDEAGAEVCSQTNSRPQVEAEPHRSKTPESSQKRETGWWSGIYKRAKRVLSGLK